MGQECSSLSMEERVQLGLLASQKLSQRQIAAQLGRSPATINRELAHDRPRKILDVRTPREVYTEIVQAKLAERRALAVQTVVALQT